MGNLKKMMVFLLLTVMAVVSGCDSRNFSGNKHHPRATNSVRIQEQERPITTRRQVSPESVRIPDQEESTKTRRVAR
jgi:hypothetical protein